MPTEEVSHYIFTVIWFLFLILFLFLDKKKQKSSLHIISQENYLVSLYATQVARRASSAIGVASVPSFVVFQRNYIRAVGIRGYIVFF
jgi:hypothetical protein